MPTYEDLRAYFQESGGLQDVARGAASVAIVTGLTLDVDPLWSLLYDVQEGLIAWPPVEAGHFDVSTDLSQLDYWNLEIPVSFVWLASRFQGYRRRQLSHRVKQWDQLVDKYRAHTGKERLPVIMTIVHRPL